MKTKEELAREYAYGRDMKPTLEEELLAPKFTVPTETSRFEYRAFLNGYSAAESRIKELEEKLEVACEALEYYPERDYVMPIEISPAKQALAKIRGE